MEFSTPIFKRLDISDGYGVFVRKLPSSVAALPPSMAVSSSGVRPLVLRRWRDSDWSDQGLSVPKRMWSEPCVRTIWTNFSLERKLLSGVLFKTSEVSVSYTHLDVYKRQGQEHRIIHFY